MGNLLKVVAVCMLCLFSTATVAQGYSTYQIDGGEAVKPLELKDQAYASIYQEIKEKTLDLAKVNKDIIYYIYMDGLIDQPVASNNGKGFTYYLYKDVNLKYSARGTVFMSDNSKNDLAGNSLIYGHSSGRADIMFARLKTLRDETTFQNAAPLIIYDRINDEFKIYKSFTFFTIVDGVEFILQKELPPEERYDYNLKQYERSLVKMEEGLEPDLNADIMYLQTCNIAGLHRDLRDVLGLYHVETIQASDL